MVSNRNADLNGPETKFNVSSWEVMEDYFSVIAEQMYNPNETGLLGMCLPQRIAAMATESDVPHQNASKGVFHYSLLC